MKLKEYESRFVVDGQSLYGPQVLDIVAIHAVEMMGRINESGNLPCRLVYKGTIRISGEITSIMRGANYADIYAGTIT